MCSSHTCTHGHAQPQATRRRNSQEGWRIGFRLEAKECVSVPFELERELGPTTAYDLALVHDMHIIRLDVVEQPLVMGDEDD
mmetsp:Transcript_39747/g.79450  ORF Transcript_39747/g.79450 Transcript_39747/m.79450 type:complete len:82 (+) Transcript_39747:149-394(+)